MSHISARLIAWGDAVSIRSARGRRAAEAGQISGKNVEANIMMALRTITTVRRSRPKAIASEWPKLHPSPSGRSSLPIAG
jgi:hypothetical protein